MLLQQARATDTRVHASPTSALARVHAHVLVLVEPAAANLCARAYICTYAHTCMHMQEAYAHAYMHMQEAELSAAIAARRVDTRELERQRELLLVRIARLSTAGYGI